MGLDVGICLSRLMKSVFRRAIPMETFVKRWPIVHSASNVARVSRPPIGMVTRRAEFQGMSGDARVLLR